MIFKEYAIQPKSLNTASKCRFWLSLMKLENGRQISRYPKKWKKLVYESLIDCKPREKQYIENRLFKMPKNVLKRRIHEWDNSHEIGWINNAINEDGVRPFHAIVAHENPDNIEKILVSDEVDDTHPLLETSPSVAIKRDLNGITGWVKPMIEQSSKIVFIDSFFSPGNQDFLQVLQKFIEIINNSTPNNTSKKIQYHSRETIGGSDDHFINICNQNISSFIGKGVEIEFYRWPNNEIHNRFILTDSHGGVSYNYGLSLGSPNHGMNDEINFLPQDAYTIRWNQYVHSDREAILRIAN